MMESYTIEEIMSHYLVANLLRLQQITKDYKTQRDALLVKEDGIWHNDINAQYKTIIKSVIMVDMAQNLPVNALEILIFMENVDITKI